MTIESSMALRGKNNRANGALFEQMIDAACRYYRQARLAEIEKTPEPMRPLSGANSRGQFLSCYVKRAQPDFKGTLLGGKAIVFEAKHTDADRILQSAVSEEQERQLDRHAVLGAECFVLVSFGFEQFFRVPWGVWRGMKKQYGRKYLKPEDIPQYRIAIKNGILDFL